jgi:hypothetical protein
MLMVQIEQKSGPEEGTFLLRQRPVRREFRQTQIAVNFGMVVPTLTPETAKFESLTTLVEPALQ